MPRPDGVVGLQVDRQHHAEDDDEHVRHARAVGQGRHVRAVLVPPELSRQVGVVEIAEREGDAERRQDPPEDDVLGELDHPEHQPRQHEDVQDNVGEQAEEGVPVARYPERDRGAAGARLGPLHRGPH